MHSIAVINQKGGVGKTTTAVNLSAALAASGKRVGLIDLDPQSHATLHLGLGGRHDAPNTYNLLSGEARLADIWQAVEDNLWAAPSHIDLAAAEVELAGVVGRELILRDALGDFDGSPPLDFLIIDCPPSLGILTINALSAAADVLLPLQPHYLALHGLSKLLHTIELVRRRLNDRLRLAGIVLSLYDSATRLAAEVSADVAVFLADGPEPQPAWRQARLFETRIRRNVRLAEAPSFEQSIFRYAPNSAGADDYRALAAEVLALYAAGSAPAAAA